MLDNYPIARTACFITSRVKAGAQFALLRDTEAQIAAQRTLPGFD